jgi:CysZ protein
MKNLLAGARTLGAGFGMILRSPKLLFLGAVPALISSVLLLGVLGGLLYFSADLTSAMTPFAETWSPAWRGALRVVLGVALVGAAVMLCSLSFIALTLLIGGPFYEHIAEKAEQELGLDQGGDGVGWARSLGRGVVESIKLVLIALAGAVVLFFLGFVPVAGQVVTPVLAALFGAWVISLEMVGMVFQRRGLKLGDRHRALRRHRAVVLGFGVPTYLVCLIPVVQLVAIPSAVVGGTMLAHRVLGPVSKTPQRNESGG